VSRQELEPRYEKLVNQLTPEALGEESSGSKVTSDTTRLRLKGKPMKIVTESEPYVDGAPIGIRDLESQEEFNEKGDLAKAVLFSAGLPETVRVYGYLSGDRAYREQRKASSLVLVIPEDKKRNPESQPDSENIRSKLVKLKYKYDGKGQLTELRVIDDTGDEIDKFVYDSSKIEHTFSLPSLTDYAGTNKRMEKTKIKDVDTLDLAGNVTGTLRATPEQPDSHAVVIDGKVQMVSEPRFRTDAFKYQYQFDDHGNWINRITVYVQKGKSGEVEVPVQVTHRTITYFS
jgi:hypothetical protein